MTEREKQLRRSDRLRIGVILALCLILAVPVVVALAASPDPGSSTGASATTDATVAPAATPGTKAAPLATDKPKVTRPKLDGGPGRGGITITAIEGSNLALRTADGWTRTITVTSATTIRKGGQAIKLADLKVGDQIRFAQKRNDDGTYSVTAIQVPTPVTSGEVTAIAGNTLTLKHKNGKTQTVTLDATTQYKIGDAAGAKSDVKVGSRVTIQGTTSGNSFTALTVHVQPTIVAGAVTAKTGSSMTLKQRDGSSIVVHVSADTKYRVRGTKTAGLADIAIGDMASASGMVRSDGSLDATVVQKAHGKGDRGDKGDKHVAPSKAPAASTTPG